MKQHPDQHIDGFTLHIKTRRNLFTRRLEHKWQLFCDANGNMVGNSQYYYNLADVWHNLRTISGFASKLPI